MRLLPDNSQINWVPYLCLLPVLLVPLDAYFGNTTPQEWMATGLAMAVFLPLYFWSFWVRGWKAALPLGGMATLGLLTVPFNSSASIFVLYASGLAGFLDDAKRSVVALAIIITAVARKAHAKILTLDRAGGV